MMKITPVQRLQHYYRSSRRFLYLCRLHRPADIPLFLLPALWASVLAAGGTLQTAPLLALLGAALLFRCAAWVFNDWMESRLLPEAPESFIARRVVGPIEAQRLFAGLMLGAFLLILPLGLPLLYYAAVALLLLLGFPYIKTRLLLTQPYLGLCYAWIVPMSWSSQGATPGKAAWLVFTAALLWATAFATLHAIPRRSYEQRVGIRSLAQLFRDNSWLFILAMQLSAVFTLWLAGRQLQLDIFFGLGLVTALLLLPYQQWLLFSHPQEGPLRSYRSQIWSGIAIFCGIAFHFLCQC
jgi:4-hydroxybenzoate polyprenyltransferase